MHAFCIGYGYQSYQIPKVDRTTPILAMQRFAENIRRATDMLDRQGVPYHYESLEREQKNWNNNPADYAPGLGLLTVLHVYSDNDALLMRMHYGVLPLRPDWRAWFASGADISELYALNFIESEE
jgi:hypothetical protein